MDIKNNDYFFWFETNKFDKDNYRSLYFYNPVKIIKLDDPSNIKIFFYELEVLAHEYYVAGFFSYELGYYLEEAFNYKIDTSFPYALFCAFDQPVIFDHRENKFTSGNLDISHEPSPYKIENLRMNISKEEYIENINKIRDYIHKGDIYQANYTLKYYFDFSGSSQQLYMDLKSKQNVAYNVYAKFGETTIVSLTPELFFTKKGNIIQVKPMKGTYKRGRNIFEDREYGQFLKNDEKNRSENLMIVDLLRNDIGKISRKGSVNVTTLFDVEKYNTLFQMTSTIESKLEENISLYKLFKSIFPSGSVTGAPKIRSMERIFDLEKDERKIYTGSLGFFEPNGNAIFNVAIRTILIHKTKAEMGIGGGIIYDSTPEDEFLECKLKAQFLTKKSYNEFCFIETILFDKNFRNLNLHIARLKESAEYFDYKLNDTEFLLKLNQIVPSLIDGKYKVRVLLNKSGEIQITYTKIKDIKLDYNITISDYRTDSNNIFLYHKTTNRELYTKEFTRVREDGYFDIIFLNEKDEVTEGSITNIYIKKNKIIFTPPIECGLLNGTIRRNMIKKNNVQEKILTLEDIYSADIIYISNAIIGLKKVNHFKYM